MAHNEKIGTDPRAVDVRVLCRNAGTIEGDWPLAAMTRLATSPELRQSMSQAALACREQRSWKVYGDRWAALLSELA